MVPSGLKHRLPLESNYADGSIRNYVRSGRIGRAGATHGARRDRANFGLRHAVQLSGGVDGAEPNGVTLGKGGVLYGTTYTGGPNKCHPGGYRCGTVFELTPSTGAAWTKTVLYSFSGADGAAPGASMVFGGNGALYGTTKAGGTGNNGGTVFELAPPATTGGVWTETVLYSLPGGADASRTPYGLLVGPSGAIYGTAYASTENQGYPAGGTVFTLTPPAVTGGSWTAQTLVSFWPITAMGNEPSAGVVSAGGSLYGTTSTSDADEGGCGSVYELSPPSAGSTWTGTAIHSFGGADGCSSQALLTVGPDDVLYGTTLVGGSGTVCNIGAGGCGTVFQLTPPATAGGAWTEAVIYNFTGSNGDGAIPSGGLALGKNGALYGTTAYGGSDTSGSLCRTYTPPGCGTVFKLTPPATSGGAWTETVLHSFTDQNGDGLLPGPLTISPGGVLYGSTLGGGTAGYGTVFALEP